MKPGISIKNLYTIRKVDKDGNESVEARFHNIPLQTFYNGLSGSNSYASRDNTVHSCWFGTGSSEPTGSETSLEKPLWTYSWNYSNIISWKKYLNEERHICIEYTFKVEADTSHVGTVSEVGVTFTTASMGMALATRALILDAEGNPMTIEKTDLEVLYVDVLFEFTLIDTDDFKWLPENFIGHGALSGTGWGPMFSLGRMDRVFFLGKVRDNGFHIRHAAIAPSKSYQNSNRRIIFSNGRLPQTTVTSQRYIKGLAVGSNTNNIIYGYWKLPNADIIAPKVLSGMQVGVGDGETTKFNAPISEWVRDTEKIYVNDVLQVKGIDYECSNDANALGLGECSILQDMEYLGDYGIAGQNIITPIVGCGSYRNSGFQTALWNTDHRTITYGFPENAVKSIRRFRLAGFIAYSKLGPSSSSSNSNWSGAVWTIEYSDDQTNWEVAADVTIVNNVAEVTFDELITARYWRFTISSKITGIFFAATSADSLMAYGDEIPITFMNPPAADAVITMDATVECPMKNENFIIDCNPTFEISGV